MALAESCLVFMLVSTPAQEREAGLLLDSLARAGGALARCERRVVLADPETTPGEALRARGATLVALERNPQLEAYPFGPKVLACAQVEKAERSRRRNLIFFDTDILVLKPQDDLLLRGREGVALRPVHLANLGQAVDAPVDPFWAPIHAALGLTPRAIPALESFVDARRIRAYYNCAILSVRSNAGVFSEWARVFTALVQDPEYQRRACTDRNHQIYLHQAVLSDVLVARLGPSRIRILPPTYGYPLHLQAQVPAASRAHSFDELHSLIYAYAFRSSEGEWLNLMPATPALRQYLDESEIALTRVSDRIYRQERSCNTYVITTPRGSLVIDPSASPRSSALRRLADAHPPSAFLLTHAHRDHLSGLADWRTADSTPLIAQREHSALLAYFERLAPFFAARNAAIDGTRPAAPATPSVAATQDPPKPTVLFADSHSLQVDGLQVELRHTPGETPDHATVWLPDLKAVAVGDNFYDSFPNIGTPRGTLPRSALGYVAALDHALSLEPEVLLPGHGEPILGRERVRRRLTEYRDAILTVHDAVVRGLNEGRDLRTLMEEIALPPGSRVGEFYGRVSWSVRGIYEAYAGGFSGEVADLYGGGAIDAELARLAGGPDVIARRASELAEGGDPLRGLRLANVALAVDRSHPPSWRARLAALTALRARSGNAIESGMLERAIESARERADAPATQ